jgi:hypothetical protein
MYLARDSKKFLSKSLLIQGRLRPDRLSLTRLALGYGGHQIQRGGKSRYKKRCRKQYFSTHRLFSPAENICSFPLYQKQHLVLVKPTKHWGMGQPMKIKIDML